MTPEQKAWIDNASYKSLLSKWRFAPSGDPLLSGEAGDYFAARMKELKEKMDPAEHTRISKAIGW